MYTAEPVLRLPKIAVCSRITGVAFLLYFLISVPSLMSNPRLNKAVVFPSCSATVARCVDAQCTRQLLRFALPNFMSFC